MISKKIFFTKLFRSKNKFLDLEKKLIVSLPENQHLRYFDILPVYIMEIPVVGNNLTIFKKIRLYATTITKLFYEISFFQWWRVSNSTSISLHTLDLNYVKKRFFPQLKNTFTQQTLFNNSLGITSKYFSKSKKFLRSKTSYMFSASYIRRLLTYLNIQDMYLIIRKIPVFLKDIIRAILNPTNVLYKNPYLNEVVNEKKLRIQFSFSYVFFFNNKPYGLVKKKKRGRLKRKVMKRVILLNNIID